MNNAPRLPPRLFLPAVAGLYLLAVARGLTGESAWCDEVLTAAAYPAESLRDYLGRAFNLDPRLSLSPVYYVLQYTWSCIAGDSLLALRLLSLLLGLATALLVAQIARRVAGQSAGLIAGALQALSLSQTYYAQEVRFYALLTLLALAATWAAHAAHTRGGVLRWAGLWLLYTLLLGTHAFSALLIAAHGAVALAECAHQDHAARAKLLRHAAAALGALLVLAAYAVLLRYPFAAHATAYADALPTWREVAAGIAALVGGGRFSSLSPAPWLPGGISLDLPAALLLLGIVAAGCLLPGAHRAQVRRLATCALLPVALLFAASHLWRPCFMFRYVLYAGPFLAIAAGISLACLPGARLRLALATVLLAAIAWQNFASDRPFRPGYDAARDHIQQHAAPSAEVWAFKEFNAIAVRHAPPVPPARLRQSDGLAELVTGLADSAQRGGEAWVILYRWDHEDAITHPLAAHGLATDRHDFGGMPPLVALRVYRADSPQSALAH